MNDYDWRHSLKCFIEILKKILFAEESFIMNKYEKSKRNCWKTVNFTNTSEDWKSNIQNTFCSEKNLLYRATLSFTYTDVNLSIIPLFLKMIPI